MACFAIASTLTLRVPYFSSLSSNISARIFSVHTRVDTVIFQYLMHESPVSEYDKFAYPSALYAQTHPDRLATISTLTGLRSADINRARVLELGCGDGNNLITMACTLPNSEFLGFDLAIEPIRRGQQVIADLGLKNVTLRQMSILDAPADLGVFDYIIAHGLYSWVPEAVREKILAICRDHLAENGVAYVSYNAYPGNYLRDAVRGMMRFHVQQFTEPPEQIRQARIFLKFLSEAKAKPGLWQDLLKHQFERVEKYADAGFYHDDLSAVNQPFYFHEFMEAAGRHQLQFLGEADIRDKQPTTGLTEEAMGIVQKMDKMNRVAREQYLDFISGRSFRQTLLCRQDCRLSHEPELERVCNLFAAADVSPVNSGANTAVPGMDDFQRDKAVIAAGQPVLKSALVYLGQVWPRRVPFSELLDKARERGRGPDNAGAVPGHGGGATGQGAMADKKACTDDSLGRTGALPCRSDETLDSDRRGLAEFLVRCYAIGFVDLHSHPSTFVTDISERPVASPLARLQVRNGQTIASFRHLPLRIQDELGRELLGLLDGTRDRAALLEELGKGIRSGSIPIYSDGNPVTDPQKATELLAAQLEPSLASLARLGLLVG